MPSFIYDLYWALVLAIALIVGMILFFGIGVVYHRITRLRYYVKRDRLRLFFDPIISSLKPNSPIPNLLNQKAGHVPWLVIEELLIKSLKRTQGEEKIQLMQVIEQLGYIDWYLKKLKEGNRWEQAIAAEKLGQIQSPKGIARLIEALQSPIADVQTVAVRSLASIGGNEAANQLIQKIFKVSEIEQDVSLRILKQGLISLGPIAVPLLQEALRHPSWRVRAACVDTLGEIPDVRSITDLRNALKDPEQDVRAKAAHALGKIKDVDSADLLGELLLDKAWVVRLQSIRALGILSNPKSVTLLLHRMADENWQVRAAAAESLRQFGNETIEPVLMVITHSTDRYALEQFMEELERSHLLESYIETLGDLSHQDRKSAIIIISQYVRHGTLNLLIHHLKNNPNPTIRTYLLDLLGQSRSPKIIESIQWSCQNDTNPEVRQIANEILGYLVDIKDNNQDSEHGSNQ